MVDTPFDLTTGHVKELVVGDPKSHEPVDLTGYIGSFQVQSKSGEVVFDAKAHGRVRDNGILFGPERGRIRYGVPLDDLGKVEAGATYSLDLWNPSGHHFTLMAGPLMPDSDVHPVKPAPATRTTVKATPALKPTVGEKQVARVAASAQAPKPATPAWAEGSFVVIREVVHDRQPAVVAGKSAASFDAEAVKAARAEAFAQDHGLRQGTKIVTVRSCDLGIRRNPGEKRVRYDSKTGRTVPI